MKKIIAIILLTFLFTLSPAVIASAEENMPEGTSVATEAEGTEKETPDADRDSVGTQEGGADGENPGDNVFFALFESFRDYLPEILGVLTFIGSLIVAFFYKRGLLPLVKASLSTLTGIVSDLRKRAEDSELISKENASAISERLTAAEEALSMLDRSSRELSASIEAAEGRALDRAKLTALMTEQVKLLYDIFMSSSIPQYQKELVGESVAKMREALAENEDSES